MIGLRIMKRKGDFRVFDLPSHQPLIPIVLLKLFAPFVLLPLWGLVLLVLIVIWVLMSTSGDKVLIQLTPELRKQLKVLKAKYDMQSYDDLIEYLLKKNGYWDESLEEK